MATAPVPPAPLDPCAHLLLDDQRLSRFAMELARDLYPFEQICASYYITPDMFRDQIANSAQFIRYFNEYRAIWNSETNTEGRVAIKAGAIVEDFLKKADSYLHDDSQTLTNKNDLLKTLVRLAGFGAERPDGSYGSGAGAGSPARVVINLGHAQIVLDNRQAPKPGDDAKVIEGEFTQPGNPQPAVSIPMPPTGVPAGPFGVGPVAPQQSPDNKPQGQTTGWTAPPIVNKL